jgi:hypothetical protein
VKRKPLNVSLHARESSVVEMTVAERVQLDRLAPSPHVLGPPAGFAARDPAQMAARRA